MYIHFLHKLQSVQVIDSTVYTVYPACDVIKIDLIIKQDGGRLVSLVLRYFIN